MILYHSRLRLSTPFFNFFEVFFVVAISERLLFPVFPYSAMDFRFSAVQVPSELSRLCTDPSYFLFPLSFPFPKLAAAFSREAAQESGEIMRVFESKGLCDSG